MMLMNSYFKYMLAFAIATLFVVKGYSHNPNEVNYSLEINHNKQELKVNFTPMTVVALLKKINPELANTATILLEDYVTIIEAYFNDTFQLKINGHQVNFKAISYDLYRHDATMIFQLNNMLLEDVNTIEASVSSFTDVYKRIYNNVVLHINGDVNRFNLNSEKRQFYLTNNNYQEGSLYLIVPISFCAVLFFVLVNYLIKGRVSLRLR